MKKILLLVIFLFCFSLGGIVLAQAEFTSLLGDAQGTIFTSQNLYNLMSRLACWFIRLGLIAVGIAIIAYGILFLTSRGSSQGVTYAKKSLTWALVGALVIFGVFTIILTVSSLVGYDATNYTGYDIISVINCS